MTRIRDENLVGIRLPHFPKYALSFEKGPNMSEEDFISTVERVRTHREDLITAITEATTTDRLMSKSYQLSDWCEGNGIKLSLMRKGKFRVQGIMAHIVYSLTGQLV